MNLSLNRRAEALKDRSLNDNSSPWSQPLCEYFSMPTHHRPQGPRAASSSGAPTNDDFIKPTRSKGRQNVRRLPHDRRMKLSFSKAMTLDMSSLPPPFSALDLSATKPRESRHDKMIQQVTDDTREPVEEQSRLGSSVLDDSIDDGVIKPRLLFYGEQELREKKPTMDFKSALLAKSPKIKPRQNLTSLAQPGLSAAPKFTAMMPGQVRIKNELQKKKPSMDFKAALLSKPPKIKPYQTLTSLSLPAPLAKPMLTSLMQAQARNKPRPLKTIQEEPVKQKNVTDIKIRAAAVPVRRVRFADQETFLAPASFGRTVVAKLWGELEFKIASEQNKVIPYMGTLALVDFFDLICDNVDSKTPEGADRAALILLHMLRAPCVKPDAKCFERVLAGYSLMGNTAMALEIMAMMHALYADGFRAAKPKTYLLTTFAYTWSNCKCSDRNGIEQCEHALAFYDNEEPSLKPNTSSYNALLRGWLKSGREDAAQKMKGIYRKMKCRFGNGDLRVAPDTETMSILLDAILMTGHCYWAKEVLWEMADDFEQEKSMYEPTACMFNKILKSLCASSDPDAPDTAMDIIKSWMELNQQTKLSAKPSSYSYFLLLKTWTNSHGHLTTEKAQDILKILEWLGTLTKKDGTPVKLNTSMYNVALRAFVKHKKWLAASELLKMMIDDFRDGNKCAKPDIDSVQKIVAALCSESMISQADELMRASWCLTFLSDQDIRDMAAIVLRAWDHVYRPERTEALSTDMDGLFRQRHKFYFLTDTWKENTNEFHGRACVHRLQCESMDTVIAPLYE